MQTRPNANLLPGFVKLIGYLASAVIAVSYNPYVELSRRNNIFFIINIETQEKQEKTIIDPQNEQFFYPKHRLTMNIVNVHLFSTITTIYIYIGITTVN